MDIFPLMCATDEVWITKRNLHAQELTDIENYRSVWRQTHFDITNKNNNALNLHYH